METSVPRLSTVLCGWFALKLLLSYCYVSTDFEVHRNWLAITYNLPLTKWYFENTSIWTLDYPPFFAWFEYGLARIGAPFLLNNGTVSNDSPFGIRPESTDLLSDVPTLIFQRLTVIVTDLVFVFGSITCTKFIFSDQPGAPTTAFPTSRKPLAEYVLCLLLCCNVGLLFVDNIHFQYNGFLFGLLLLSIACVGKGWYLLAAFTFAVLLNLKHIFLYLAPAYAAYFLRNYCFESAPETSSVKHKKQRSDGGSSEQWSPMGFIRSFSVVRFLRLLAVGIAVFAVSLSPFIYHGQLQQVLSRLFPFKRGLTHACWAPNFWALYNAVDYVLAKIFGRFVGGITLEGVPGYATGLVQEFDHIVLPTIKPLTTFVITVLSMIPACLIIVSKKTNWTGFVTLVTLCAFSSFLLGWHVHEKAVLVILVPLTLLGAFDYRYAKILLILSSAGYFSLFPLLFQQFESPIKYTAYLVYMIGAFWGLQTVYRLPKADTYLPRLPFLNFLETMYVLGFGPLELVCTLIDYHPVYSKKFAFAPLMLTSVYCAIGVVYCWLTLYWTFLCEELNVDTRLLMNKWRKERLLLKKKLIIENREPWQNDKFNGLRLIGGLDISTAVGDDVNAIGCLAVISFPELKVVHSICEHVMIDAPYVPGFLAFREAPVMISLVQRLRRERPDLALQVLFVDGNGVLHPDRFGLACHVGVSLNVATVGVAKDLHLVEGILPPSSSRLEKELTGAGTSLLLKANDGETLGAALRASDASKNAIFVSVGHLIDLETAVKLSAMSSRHRVPEPIRAADAISREWVRKELV